MIHGIDVSAYQSTTYSTAGLDFVIVKSTEGLSYTNPRMAAQAKRARDAGLVVGFYHYPHMANDPVAEATYFLRQTPLKAGDIVVFDWEGYDAANRGVPRSRQVAYRDAWLKYVKSKMPDHRVGMYCNTDYWLNVDTTGNCGDFLWIATGGKPAGQPGIKAKWTFHQYSTAGGIDHDVAAFDSRAALAAWSRGTIQQEDDVALTTDDKTWITKAIADGIDAHAFKAVVQKDAITAPPDAPDVATNPTWRLDSYEKDTNARLRALAKKVDGLVDVQLTDQQIATLAAAVAANPALAEQIAEKVAVKLAARLAE